MGIIGIPGGDKKEKENENIFKEIVAENFPNLKKKTSIKLQEAQWAPKFEPNRPKPRHIIIKMAKVRDMEKMLKAAREKRELIIREPP